MQTTAPKRRRGAGLPCPPSKLFVGIIKSIRIFFRFYHFFKLWKGRFIVDGFRFRSECCKAYLLSHFHRYYIALPHICNSASDHYCGLTKNWSIAPIYCSAITAALLIHHMHIKADMVHALPTGVELTIDGTTLFLIDANHCPGSV